MTVYDPAWDMPLVNWQQQGSFTDGQIPPAVAPDAGTQICIGPIAREWLYVVLGALDQLRNPSSWIVADDDAMFTVLRQVDKLKEIIATGEGCTVPALLRLNDSCTLQYSNDGGATWVDTEDWVANFGNCVRANVPDPVPPDPGDGKINQHACNIAGFLSQRVIREAMSKLSDNIIAGTGQLAWMNSLDFGLASKFPMTVAALLAFETFYNTVSVQVLAQITAAAADTTLWSDITCAIYNAIKVEGFVTDGNFAACAAAIHAVSYADFWVTNSIGNFWTAVGIGTIRNWQNVGALDDIDCTGCGESCTDLGFQSTTGGWATYGATIATWSAGIGWTAAYNGGANISRVAITKSLGGVYNVSGYEFDIVAPGGSPFVYCDLECANGGSVSGTFHVTPTASPAIQTVGLHNQTPLAADTLYIDFAVFGNWTPNMRIVDVRIYFEGPNPFGLSNCP